MLKCWYTGLSTFCLGEIKCCCLTLRKVPQMPFGFNLTLITCLNIIINDLLFFLSSQYKMVRAALVTATSLALTGAVVAHAYFLKHQFYPTVVYLTKSSPSMAVSNHELCSDNSYECKINASNIIIWLCSYFLAGLIHTGFRVGILIGKIHAEGLFWSAESCWNGGQFVTEVCQGNNYSKVFNFSFLLFYSSALDRALLVCRNGDLFSLHSVQGWFFSSICGPVHFAAVP